jgi:hypothetical protein
VLEFALLDLGANGLQEVGGNREVVAHIVQRHRTANALATSLLGYMASSLANTPIDQNYVNFM